MLKRRTRRALLPYLLIAPACILLALFVYGVVNGVLQGFGIMPFLGLTTPTLDYYVEALSRSDLSSSIAYSLYLAATSALLATIGGVALAWALTRARSGRAIQLVGIQIPLMSAHALIATCVVSLFAGSGLVARWLFSLGLLGSTTDFPTVVGATSGWGIILVYLWKEIPFIAFSTVTIMSGISDKLSEAAASLGASPARTFFSVVLPLSRGAITKAFLIVFAFAFGSYEVPFLLGPTLPKALPVLAYIEFTDPDIVNRCYAMALNGVAAAICCVLAIVYFVIVLREEDGHEAHD